MFLQGHTEYQGHMLNPRGVSSRSYIVNVTVLNSRDVLPRSHRISRSHAEPTRCFFQVIHCQHHSVELTRCSFQVTRCRSHSVELMWCFFQLIHCHGHSVELTRCSFQVTNCVEVTVLNLRGQGWDHQDLDFTCWTTAGPHYLIMTSPQPAMTSLLLLLLKVGLQEVGLASGRSHLY